METLIEPRYKIKVTQLAECHLVTRKVKIVTSAPNKGQAYEKIDYSA